jgi:thiamine biosynthesis lipoprotein
MKNAMEKPTRRDFIRGKALHDLVQEAVAHRLGAPLADTALPERHCVVLGRYAMGTTFQVWVPTAEQAAAAAALAALEVIEKLEDQLTVYHDRSEVAAVNRRAFEEPVTVERRLFELLQHCVWLYEETGGAFDVAIGSLIDAWGFAFGPPRVPEPELVLECLVNGGTKNLELIPAIPAVRFRGPRVKLNFGSIGKGYALDRAAEVLQDAWGVGSVLLQGGRSSVLARGTPNGSNRGWPVALQNPLLPGETLATVWLSNQALGTTANTIKVFQSSGKRYGHVLDPRTGWPAEGLLQVSAVAPTGADADALSTAFFVLGREGTEAFCEKHPEVGAILVLADSMGSLELRPIGEVAWKALEFVD